MNISATITVSDHLYDFYRKVAQELGNTTAEEIMAKALSMCAGIVAAELLYRDDAPSF